MTLQDFFKEYPKVALAFSGGVDSAYLLYAAKRYGADVKAYYVKTPFQPHFEYEDALALAGQLQVAMQTVELDVLADCEIAANPQNRCYFCKKRIFGAICHRAARDGYQVIPTGMTITPELLEKTERCESFLMGLGFRDFRIRIIPQGAKLQLKKEQLPLLEQHRQEIFERLNLEYGYVLENPEVRA